MPRTVKTEVSTRQDFARLIDEMGLKVGVELGVDKGYFSNYLLENSKLDVLYSIDAWQEGTGETLAAPRKAWTVRHGDEVKGGEATAREVLGRHGDSSVVVKALSFDAAAMFANADGTSDPGAGFQLVRPIDFIMFDAGHRFTGFALDLIRWWPKIRTGGVIAGHDYWRRYRYEVMDVANAFCAEHKLLMRLTWGDTSLDGRAYASPSFWTIKEALTKREFFDALPETLAGLRRAKAILKDKGVRVVLPYQYADQEEADE